MHGIISQLFDCWAYPVAHLLILKSSMGRVNTTFGEFLLKFDFQQVFSNMGQTRPLFVYFRPFLDTTNRTDKYITKLDHKSVYGVLWIRTRDYWMLAFVESTELWQLLISCIQYIINFSKSTQLCFTKIYLRHWLPEQPTCQQTLRLRYCSLDLTTIWTVLQIYF